MNLLNVIDQMEFKEYLIFISLFFAIVNFVAWVVLMKRQKLGKSLKAMADKLVKNGGFIDPILFMFGAAFMAGMALWYVEVPPKKDPDCRTVTIIQHVEQKPPVKKKPPKIKPCNVNN